MANSYDSSKVVDRIMYQCEEPDFERRHAHPIHPPRPICIGSKAHTAHKLYKLCKLYNLCEL